MLLSLDGTVTASSQFYFLTMSNSKKSQGHTYYRTYMELQTSLEQKSVRQTFNFWMRLKTVPNVLSMVPSTKKLSQF